MKQIRDTTRTVPGNVPTSAERVQHLSVSRWCCAWHFSSLPRVPVLTLIPEAQTAKRHRLGGLASKQCFVSLVPSKVRHGDSYRPICRCVAGLSQSSALDQDYRLRLRAKQTDCTNLHWLESRLCTKVLHAATCNVQFGKRLRGEL